MANIVYPLILFLFIFGAFSTYISESGFYQVNLPNTGIESSVTEAQQVNEAMLETAKNPSMSIVEQLFLFGKCIVGGILAILTLGPLLQSYGMDVGLAGFFISPIAFIMVWWLFDMWLGRSTQ